MNKADLIQNVNSLIDEIEELRYFSQHTKLEFSCNVKLHASRNYDWTLDKLLSKPEYQKIAGEIEAEFDEENVASGEYSLWYNWVEYEQSYIINDYLSGCTVSGADWWSKIEDQIEAGIETAYPHLNEKRTMKSKLKELAKWVRKDKFEGEALDLIDQKSAGFYGRSGGHFSFDATYSLTDYLNEILDDLDWQTVTVAEAVKSFREIRRDYKQVVYILDFVESCAKGMTFQDEVDFRVEMFAEELLREAQLTKDLLEKETELLENLED